VKYVVRIAVVFLFVVFANTVPSARAADPAAARSAAIDARLVKLAASKDTILKGLRAKIEDIETIKNDLETKDADCRRIRQRLRELGAETEALKREMEKRLASVSRYASLTAAYAKSMEELQGLRETESQLLNEKQVLEGKTTQP